MELVVPPQSGSPCVLLSLARVSCLRSRRGGVVGAVCCWRRVSITSSSEISHLMFGPPPRPSNTWPFGARQVHWDRTPQAASLAASFPCLESRERDCAATASTPLALSRSSFKNRACAPGMLPYMWDHPRFGIRSSVHQHRLDAGMDGRAKGLVGR